MTLVAHVIYDTIFRKIANKFLNRVWKLRRRLFSCVSTYNSCNIIDDIIWIFFNRFIQEFVCGTPGIRVVSIYGRFYQI